MKSHFQCGQTVHTRAALETWLSQTNVLFSPHHRHLRVMALLLGCSVPEVGYHSFRKAYLSNIKHGMGLVGCELRPLEPIENPRHLAQ